MSFPLDSAERFSNAAIGVTVKVEECVRILCRMHPANFTQCRMEFARPGLDYTSDHIWTNNGVLNLRQAILGRSPIWLLIFDVRHSLIFLTAACRGCALIES